MDCYRKGASVITRLVQIRFQSTKPTGPIAPFASHANQGRKVVAFDKNMPEYVRQKAWERAGEDKETFFKRKHAHHHVQRQPQREESERRYEGIERKKHRERMAEVQEREKEREYRDHLRKLSSNPNIDYMYGTNAVLAALKGGKRSRFGKLYLHNPKDTEKVNEILALAQELQVKVVEFSKQEINQLTNNGVHNGIALETRPLEVTTIHSMSSEFDQESFSVQSKNTLLNIRETLPYSIDSFGKRFPFGIYLDEISDPHNVGAILRSAYFLGVDFVVFSERNCAPLSPVVAKASSGAIEFLDLFKIEKPLSFFDETSKNGWKLISTVAPTDKRNKSKLINTREISELLKTDPVILVVGSEGAGIRTNLINRSDFLVSVDNGRIMNECVDSLNVSVATALLVSKILA